MNAIAPPNPDLWGSRTTFVLALSASAIGLGNFWRFSWLSGEYGGGDFVICYVMCLFLVAVPVLIAEVLLGSYGGRSPVDAIRRACDGSLRSRSWAWVGALACLSGVLLLTCYIVVAGWGLAYAGFMRDGAFAAARIVDVGEHFEKFLAEPMQQVFWQSIFLLLACVIVLLGVRRGLGVLVWIAVPVMLSLLGFLVKFAFDHGDIAAARSFLFATSAVDFTPQSALLALGHALFTLGIGVGTGISYGAYAPRQIPIGRSVMAVAVFDVVIALLAGLAIYPVIFANNMEPASGPGLLFISLPYAYGNLMQGELVGTAFFALMVLAALGSVVAILEPIIAMLMQQTGIQRFTAVVVVGAVLWLLAWMVVTTSGSTFVWQWFGLRNLLAVFDALVARLLLPLVALLLAVLVGWRLRPQIMQVELLRETPLFFSLWRFLLRYIAPAAIVLYLLGPFWPSTF